MESSSMAITQTASNNYDTPLMPPPKKVLRRGTMELDEALRRGEVALSIPDTMSQWYEENNTLSHHRPRPSSSANNNIPVPFIDNNDRFFSSESAVCISNHEMTYVGSGRIISQSIEDDDNKIEEEEEEDEERLAATVESQKGEQEQQQQDYPVPNDCESNYSISTKEFSKSREQLVSTRFHDVIGHGAAKLRIQEVLLPLALPRDLTDSILTGIRSMSSNILLFGPPGCGKTQLARAIAGEAEAAFLAVSPSDILSKYVGESENAISSLFDKAKEKARNVESFTAVIFFDEIDALGQARGGSTSGSEIQGGTDSCSRRVLAELLIRLNQDNMSAPCATTPNRTSNDLEEDYSETCSVDDSTFVDENTTSDKPLRVIVVAATNRPEDCDPALLRRFMIRILVGLPDQRDRKRILRHYLTGIQHSLSKAQIEDVVSSTEGWSGSDLESLTREAAMAPVRECIRFAVRLKRKSRDSEKRRGDFLHRCAKDTAEEPRHETMKRKQLLQEFQNLRPVSKEDFDEAINFWIGNHNAAKSLSTTQGHINQGTNTFSSRSNHYDSSSDEED